MSKKHTYKDVKEYIESNGQTLLSNSYINSYSKLLLKCPIGHEYSISYKDFRNNVRCTNSNCISERISASKRKPFSEIERHCNSIGLHIISGTYKERSSKISVVCPIGHEYTITVKGLLNSKMCKICRRHQIANEQSLNYNDVKLYIESFGYKLLSKTYSNCYDMLTVQCDKNHVYKTKFINFNYNNSRCPICNVEKQTSKGEQDLALYIESLGIPIVKNDRSILVNPLTGKNLELDIYMPSLNKAIEYNGLYWHSFINVQKKDIIKKDQCKKLNIDLLTITDEKWVNNQETEMMKIKKWLKLE